jgi:hypothetical protein
MVHPMGLELPEPDYLMEKLLYGFQWGFWNHGIATINTNRILGENGKCHI